MYPILPMTSSTLPNLMKAMTVTAPGSGEGPLVGIPQSQSRSQPQSLSLMECHVPQPASGQVLIHVYAAGVNRADILQRQGWYPISSGSNPILGLEISGKIVAKGPHVDHVQIGHVQIGDEVCALIDGGGYAEYAVADVACCMPIPKGWSLIDAASLPEAIATVWWNIVLQAGMESGQSLLVHGGSSGIGTMAIQIAKWFGIRVAATVSNDKKSSYCKELGADHVIIYTQEDFVESVLKWSNNQGVDVILDMVGGDYTPRNLACLAKGGRVLQIAYLRGRKSEIDWRNIMQKQLHLSGSMLRPQSLKIKTAIIQDFIKRGWGALEDQSIKPCVFQIFELEEAQKAHELMESGHLMGKIVLKNCFSSSF